MVFDSTTFIFVFCRLEQPKPYSLFELCDMGNEFGRSTVIVLFCGMAKRSSDVWKHSKLVVYEKHRKQQLCVLALRSWWKPTVIVLFAWMVGS
jgi:hypothetical protein